MISQPAKAELFRQLHQKNSRLLLPNAWDVASARIFEEAGFSAIATTSAGIAFARGYADGEKISRAEMLENVGRIVAAVQVPVTADIEAGYGPKPANVAATIRGVIEAGAVGVNLEDTIANTDESLYSIDAQAERIQAAREEANKFPMPFVINARIDTYMRNIAENEKTVILEETLQRAEAYLAAGATSIFVPNVVEPNLIKLLVENIPAPLNTMATPQAPAIPELFELGVARVSIGVAAMLTTLGLLRETAQELYQSGTYQQLGRYTYRYAEAQKLYK